MYCQVCGKENNDKAKFCLGCGASLNADSIASNYEPAPATAPAPVQVAPSHTQEGISIDAGLKNMMGAAKKNTIGTVGFVLALISVYLYWVPIIGQIMWLLGIIFCVVGVYKTPKVLSTAGLALSYIVLAWIINILIFLSKNTYGLF